MRILKKVLIFIIIQFCFCLPVFAADVHLSSAKISSDGVLSITGSVTELEKEQFVTVVICPIREGSCDFEDIRYIDQKEIKDKDFTLVYALLLDNGVYAARIGGNGITVPQYLIITKDSDLYDIKLGDVDGNGVIEAADSTILLQYILNKAAVILSPLQLKAANVTGNTELTAEDAAWILQKTLNGSVLFPAETNN